MTPDGGWMRRRFAPAAAALAAVVALASSCARTGVNSLAGPVALSSAPAALVEFDPTAEGVEVVPPGGTAAPMARLLARSVVEGLARYNAPAVIAPGASPGLLPGMTPPEAAIVRPGVAGRFMLTGHAGPNRDPALNSVIAVEWRVFDRRENREVGRFVDGVTADQFAWDNGDPRIIYGIGESAAYGFSTLVMRTPPVVVAHGPVDPKAPAPSVLGALPATTVIAAMSSDPTRPPLLASATQPVPTVISGVRAQRLSESDPPPQPAATAVFLVPVTGAPGDGNSALTRGIRAALAARGYTLAESSSQARYLLAGSVDVGVIKAGRQPVRVVWEVSDAQGRSLGRAVQENAVAAGSLDKSWGGVASVVAGAAVPGITDVMRRAADVAAAQTHQAADADRGLKIPSTLTLPPVNRGQAMVPSE